MKRATIIRVVLLGGCLVTLELACRLGYVSELTMVPPSIMAVGLVEVLRAPEMRGEIVITLTGIAYAVLASVSAGFLLGCLLRAWPRARAALEPLLATYYAVPTFIFYPMFIVFFGMNRTPIVVIGFMFAFIAMMTSTMAISIRVKPRCLRMVFVPIYPDPRSKCEELRKSRASARMQGVLEKEYAVVKP